MTNDEIKLAKYFAEHLFNRYLYECGSESFSDNAREYAMICIDEIEDFYDSKFILNGSKTEEYFNEVRKQLELL